LREFVTRDFEWQQTTIVTDRQGTRAPV